MQVFHAIEELSSLSGARVALTIGYFDGVHLGHQQLLSRLALQAQRLSAQSLVVTFSNSPRGFHHPEKHWRYLSLPDEKLELLAAQGLSATLVLQYDAAVASQNAAQFLVALAAQARLVGLCVGYDSSIGCDMLRGQPAFAALCSAQGLELEFVEPYPTGSPPVKSSHVRDLVSAGDVRAARAVLGHAYFVSGVVSSGKGKGGAVLGVPTANIYLPQEKLTPPLGIYAGIAETAQEHYPAAICVISRAQALRTVLERGAQAPEPAADPTAVVVEAHLIGFSGNLYHEPLKLRFLERLRDFQDFATPDELRAQIERDVSATRVAAEAEIVQADARTSAEVHDVS